MSSNAIVWTITNGYINSTINTNPQFRLQEWTSGNVIANTTQDSTIDWRYSKSNSTLVKGISGTSWLDTISVPYN